MIMMTYIRFFPLILALMMFVFPSSLYCQHEGKARLKGIVTDEEGNSIPGVKVKLFSIIANSGFETRTDNTGAWKAMWIRGGKWNIDFDKQGYEPKKIHTTLKQDGKLVTIETTLKKLKGPAIRKDMVKDFERGTKLFDEGNFQKAGEVFQGILEKFPDAYAVNVNIGNCHFQLQQYEKAIAAYEKVLAKEPDHTGVLISIGNCYSNMKQPDKALEQYKKIDVEKIDDPVVLYNIGVFNFNAGNAESSLKFFKRSVEVKADFKDGWYQLGMVYMSGGDNKTAVASFEKYLELDATSDQAAQVREILNALKQ